MIKQCPYDESRFCELWIDYQITAAALEEADMLCRGNWNEILALRERIDLLESIITAAGLKVPPSDI